MDDRTRSQTATPPGLALVVGASQRDPKGRIPGLLILPALPQLGGRNAGTAHLGGVDHPEKFQHGVAEKVAAIGRALARMGIGGAPDSDGTRR